MAFGSSSSNVYTHYWVLAVPFRILNALVSRTFFQPDEYWQSLEIAHSIAFGYGYRTWEWRTIDGNGGIRSVVVPWVFSWIYSGLAKVGLDDTVWLILAPKLVQSLVAAWCDYATFKVARKLLSPRHQNTALFCSITSFFNFYASTRTFSNSTETALTVTALYYWPLQRTPAGKLAENNDSSLTLALIFAALATISRPSSAVIWIVLGVNSLYRANSFAERRKIALSAFVVGTIALLGSFAIDSRFYGAPTFTPLNFLRQNVFNSISLFYGSNTTHFYFTQAIPFLTLTQLPFVIHGFFLPYNANGGMRVMRWVVGITVGVYSALGHKEFRFIHPLLPILNLFAARSLVHLYDSSIRVKPTRIPVSSTPLARLSTKLTIPKPYMILLLASLIPAIYLTSFHAVAQVSVVDWLRNASRRGEVRSIGMLMPCHSTPWQSHLHRGELEMDRSEREGGGGGRSGEGGRVWFITCEPPVLGQNSTTYLDQSDFFYASPLAYLHDRFPPHVDPSFPLSPVTLARPGLIGEKMENDLGWKHSWPSHIVLFDSLLGVGWSDGEGVVEQEAENVGELLEARGYREEGRLWNSHFHEERRSGDVVILRWYDDL